ncbi:hypothetical protein AAFX91_12705 [Bradyrhizobium sp. 31Argb]|uniref:hypothetical protein n=1 Tax=unclassified Bradyrhizobium TaxID=2631580 RepID=UPI00102E2D08|nr:MULTISPECIES: hypothetical protein [unclassified Bradyrhizobium]MDI4237258.1 hypothetical protein [Bradyrhizobium sp. Arg237L]
MWRRRGARALGVALGALAVLLGAKPISAKAATDVDGRLNAAQAPAAWQDFAKRLQLRLQERLASDSTPALRFHDAVARRASDVGAAPPSIVVRVWVMPDGKVQRIELEGLDNDASHDLSALLIGDGVGSTPLDMPQPLRMRLSLRPNTRVED